MSYSFPRSKDGGKKIMAIWWATTVGLSYILGIQNLIEGFIKDKNGDKPVAFLHFIISALSFTLLIIALLCL